MRTGFAYEFDSGPAFGLLYRSFLRNFLISPVKGADTLVWLVSSEPGRAWRPGEYYVKRKIKEPSKQAKDPILVRHLWELSAKLTGTQVDVNSSQSSEP